VIDLSGKVILVVGGSGLIGRQICLDLARCGAQVIPTYRTNFEGAETLRGGWEGYSNGGTILPPVLVDVTNTFSIMNLAERIKQVGSLSGLVYCAGINRPNHFDQITQSDWFKVIETNLDGAFFVTQALLPQIRDGGSVVFIGSVSAALAGPTSTHYACSKSGLITLSQNLALFAAPRQIRVNTVSPGYVRSPMAEAGQVSEAVRKKIEQTPLERLAEPGDISPLVAFLMDGKVSGFITGQNFGVNGGLSFG
jgi:3-oxoacyl-[acyl-carrier protein] reductase